MQNSIVRQCLVGFALTMFGLVLEMRSHQGKSIFEGGPTYEQLQQEWRLANDLKIAGMCVVLSGPILGLLVWCFLGRRTCPPTNQATSDGSDNENSHLASR
jgi:hypothetical protein